MSAKLQQEIARDLKWLEQNACESTYLSERWMD